MNNNLPNRKILRYKHFNYNEGTVFITICTKDRKLILSRITPIEETKQRCFVGDGASTSRSNFLGTPRIELTEIGEIVEKYILSSKNMNGIKIGNYVIMPNHIHLLVAVDGRRVPAKCDNAPIRDVGAPSPTNERQNLAIPHFVSALKRLCNKEIGENIFQRSYFDHVIRSEEDLDMHIDYILHNPENWYFDELYSNG